MVDRKGDTRRIDRRIDYPSTAVGEKVPGSLKRKVLGRELRRHKSDDRR